MIGFLNRLNLQPQERRLVVISCAVLFVVLNLWLVWPHFAQLPKVLSQLEGARQTLDTYRAELARADGYRAELDALEREGSAVLAEEQAITLTSVIQAQAQQNGVAFRTLSQPQRSSRYGTNSLFEELTVDLNLNPTSAESVLNFLVSVAASDIVIRVKELQLRPDRSQSQLEGKIAFVASFQKRTPATKPAARETAATRRPES